MLVCRACIPTFFDWGSKADEQQMWRYELVVAEQSEKGAEEVGVL